MLAIRGRRNLDLGKFHPIGSRWSVRWVPVDDPLAITESCYAQGAALGGARFSRLEGAWWGVHTGYFLSTNGGSAGEGQVFEYDPRSESLTVIYDAPNANSLDNPDNIAVTPRGSLLLCEDAAGNGFTEGERMVGLTVHGETFTFAMNNMNLSIGLQRHGSGRRLPPERVGRRLLQPRRQVAVREHSDPGGDVRHHRALVPRSALAGR